MIACDGNIISLMEDECIPSIIELEDLTNSTCSSYIANDIASFNHGEIISKDIS